MKNTYHYWLQAKQITPRLFSIIEQDHVYTDFKTSAFAKSHVSTCKHIFSRFRSCITDQKRRSAFEHRELSRRIFKSTLITNKIGNKNGKWKNIQLNRLACMQKVNAKAWAKKGTITVIRNRCVLTGRNSVISKLGLSRICFRRLAGIGSISGIIKI